MTAPAGGTSALRSAVWWAAALCAGTLRAVVALDYDPTLVGKCDVPRSTLLYPLTPSVVVLTLVQRRRRTSSPGVDALDILALVFGAGQALAVAVSPSPVIARCGYDRCGMGAMFWIALSVLLVAMRR